jgi:hypothetical protein
MTFVANVGPGNQENTTLTWSVTQGTITSGQGTPTITVDTTGLSDTTITATVTLGGTNPDCRCTTEANATGVVAALPQPRLIEEVGPLTADDLRARIDNLFIELQNDPAATGYIINYGPPRQVTARERIIRSHIQLRRYDATRVVIVNGGEEAEIRTRIYIVPQGATPPTP